MQTMNERPVCHRSEDLVTYLYNEASAAEAQDFASHVETCEACRAEFAVFSQVHESILLWRNEALGSAFSPAPQAAAVPAEATDSRQFVRHERKLPALAALREFFSVSPLWLRGATAFAALLLCLLAVLAISRLAQRPDQVVKIDPQLRYSQQDFDQALQKGIDERVAKLNRENSQKKSETSGTVTTNKPKSRVQLAANRAQPRARGLTRAEREQLLADLRLTPGRDDEELPFVFPDEPIQ
jgi:C4-dicarboxylate-specific signal transduction histidine kinase